MCKTIGRVHVALSLEGSSEEAKVLRWNNFYLKHIIHLKHKHIVSMCAMVMAMNWAWFCWQNHILLLQRCYLFVEQSIFPIHEKRQTGQTKFPSSGSWNHHPTVQLTPQTANLPASSILWRSEACEPEQVCGKDHQIQTHKTTAGNNAVVIASFKNGANA